MADNRNYGDPLDELLDKLSSGDFIDQSVYEFSEIVNDTVQNYHQAKNSSKGRTTYQKTSYTTTKPHIRTDVETADYNSRQTQVIACLDNLVYDNYAEERMEGYKQCIERYRQLTIDNQYDLRPVEKQISQDISTCQKKMRQGSGDSYTQGYYDALLMVKKILSNSKLARLRELSNSI